MSCARTSRAIFASETIAVALPIVHGSSRQLGLMLYTAVCDALQRKNMPLAATSTATYTLHVLVHQQEASDGLVDDHGVAYGIESSIRIEAQLVDRQGVVQWQETSEHKTRALRPALQAWYPHFFTQSTESMCYDSASALAHSVYLYFLNRYENQNRL